MGGAHGAYIPEGSLGGSGTRWLIGSYGISPQKFNYLLCQAHTAIDMMEAVVGVIEVA